LSMPKKVGENRGQSGWVFDHLARDGNSGSNPKKKDSKNQSIKDFPGVAAVVKPLQVVGTSVQHSTPESVANTHVRAASMSGLFGKECTATDPEFCERFEILFVTTSNREFLPTFNA